MARAAAEAWREQLQEKGRILGQVEPTPLTRTGNWHKSQGRKAVISCGRAGTQVQRGESGSNWYSSGGSREEPRALKLRTSTTRQNRGWRLLWLYSLPHMGDLGAEP